MTLAASLAAPVSHGTELHVAPEGIDTGDCTVATPCATLEYAISRMVDGDVLLIADGRYSTGFASGLSGCVLDASSHIHLTAADSCDSLGCTIRAQNVTNPPSVILDGAQMGIYAVGARNWRIEGVELNTEQGVYACGTENLNLIDVTVSSLAQDNGTAKNFFSDSEGLTLRRVQMYLQGKPCANGVGPFYGVRLSDVRSTLIEDSYLGFVNQLISMSAVDTLTIRRSHFQHWTNHGLAITRGSHDILIENNVFGGSSDPGCSTAPMFGPRTIDVYESRNLVVRNNTFVGHGYSPRSMAISYFQFGNTIAGCELSPTEPGFCEFDTAVSCTGNDIPPVPAVADSATSSDCPSREDGLPWSPHQRCSGVCEHENVKFYNNLVYDLRDTGVPEAGTRYIDWLAQGRWAGSTDLRFDGNYYAGGVERWICGGGGGDKLSMQAWRAAQCVGGPNPDPSGIVGRCSASEAACGTDGDCPPGEACLPTDPAFVDYAGEDYRPAPGALQIDAGLSGIDAQGVARCASEDFVGNPRCDGACDIGAFEVAKTDDDLDGILCDNCPGHPNPAQVDADDDGVGDACDLCPQDPLNDADADGLCGGTDNCPAVANPGQEDADGDSVGDLCDDGDADGILDIHETGTGIYVSDTDTGTDPGSADTDGDGYGDGDEIEQGFDPTDSTSAPGGVPFGASAPIAGGPEPTSVDLGDIDGDGDLDVLWADARFERVSWQANNAGVFGAPQTVTSSAPGATSAVLADVDGDGDLDAVWTAAGSGTVAWQANTDAAGAFGATTTIDSASVSASGVTVEDIDGDGDLDVVAIDSDSVAWYANMDGAGNFGTAIPIGPPIVNGRAVVAADLDGDGDSDIALVSGTALAWHENEGGGAAWTPHTLDAGLADGAALTVADLDGNGTLDMALATSGDGAVTWYANAGGGAFSPVRMIGTLLSGARALTAGDLDEDGDRDLVAAGDSDIVWYDNTLGTGAAWGVRDVGFPGARSTVVADVEGDGDLDVLVAAMDGTVSWYRNRRIHSNAVFPSRRVIAAGADSARAVAVADVDGDGDRDLVSASALNDGIAWHENLDRDGTNWQTHTLSGNADFASAVATADVDRDGDRDVVFAAAFAPAVGWFENLDGDGTDWTRHDVDTAAALPLSVAAVDIDGDGDPDLVSASFGSDEVAWHENLDGSGTSWATRTIDPVRPGARGVHAVDLDRDGDADVLAAAALDDSVAWYENLDGFGTSWARRLIDGAALLASGVAAADLDGDGDRDALAALAAENTVAWYENEDGAGLVWTRHEIDLDAGFALAVAAADLDGDGDPDVVAASAGDNAINWYENVAGDASGWIAHTLTASALQAWGVATADVDADGRRDVVSASAADDTIAWYPNRGGQYGFAGQALAPPAAVAGSDVTLLSVDLTHNGSTGDPDIELSRLEFRFERGPGWPLAAAEVAALIEAVEIHRDDGSGTFESGVDVLVLSEPAPVAVAGHWTVALPAGDPLLEVAVGQTVRFFARIRWTAGAATAVPDRLQAIHRPSGSSARDEISGIRLRSAQSPDVASGVVVAVEDADGDGVPSDGDLSGVAGDRPCAGAGETDCDDNCPLVANDQTDSDGDGFGEACDGCPDDPLKLAPGLCGCGLIENACLGYAEDFDSLPVGGHPDGWIKTGPNYDLTPLPETDPLFRVMQVDKDLAYGTDSTAEHIHAHYVGQAFEQYEYIGRMRFDGGLVDMGLVFTSQFPEDDSYYRLRRFSASTTFQLVPRGDSMPLFGDKDTGVVPVEGVWYRFRVRVEHLPGQTEVRVNVWEDGTVEPAGWQAAAWNSNPGRPVSGSVGVWTRGIGVKYWDDLAVLPLPLPDLCPDDPNKTDPGACGCGRPDADADGDGVADCLDACPEDSLKFLDPGTCGCGVGDADSDGDGTPDCDDGCSQDLAKTEPGLCGCGIADAYGDLDVDGTVDCLDGCPAVADDQTDSDGDGSGDACDGCPTDPAKSSPGVCGCGVTDGDRDGDGTLDCLDGCPDDEAKTAPGLCGCGTPDADADADAVVDCLDNCPGLANDQQDADQDGVGDVCDGCPADGDKIDPGDCGCGFTDLDSDGDGTANCIDACPTDPAKVDPGQCGCFVADDDPDADGAANCVDNCPTVFNDQADGDGDGAGDACDECPTDPTKVFAGFCGCGVPESACAWGYADDFDGLAPGSKPADWVDTGPGNSLEPVDPQDPRFLVADLDGETVYGTTSIETNLHSHYQGPGSASLSSYEYSGRMLITAERGGIGVTFFSRYNDEDVYYRLRRFEDLSFHLAPHGDSIDLSGTLDTGVVPEPDTWYRFRIQVHDGPLQTEIRARVWSECDPEPAVWQIDALDAHPGRPRGGTFGLWSFLIGGKYWDDLTVGPFSAADACPADPDKTHPGACGCGFPDEDGDGNCIADCLEACVDGDGDGYGSACPLPDCDDGAPEVWAPPGDGIRIEFTAADTLVWSIPDEPGGAVSALTYDVLRSASPASFVTGVCVLSGGGATTVSDATTPLPGEVLAWLVRARNACPAGQGGLGHDTEGNERVAVDCP